MNKWLCITLFMISLKSPAQIPAEMGHWQIKNNIHRPQHTIVEFYTADYKMVYQEQLNRDLELNTHNIRLMDMLFLDFMSRYYPDSQDSAHYPAVLLEQVVWQEPKVESRLLKEDP